MNEDWFSKFSDEHYLEIGKAVSGWGELESLIYEYINKHIDNEILYDFLSKSFRSFTKRQDYLFVLLRAKFGDSEELKKLKNTFNESAKLATRRNDIAHNPMNFWLNDDGTDIVGGIIHGRTQLGVDIDLQAIKTFREEVHTMKFKIMNSIIDVESRNI